ncbi:MAG: murein biosynthesis integral membrane protein MurJ [Zoogloeaceae bacterium]|jgi:putative peptidoglycan lipid II flippase|nr:murein biosynthesis integral membrane protein MurJ [Zoogloeaceae bacterium]
MNLLRALATVSGMTMFSRILGFARDYVIADVFKTSFTDAFFVAFKLPNLLRRLFAEGAFSQAFVPILGEYKNKQGIERTRELLNHTATVLSFVLFLVTCLGVLVAPALVLASAPGFTAEPGKFALTVTLTRIAFPYILFMSLTAMAAGILNTWSRFVIPALTPALLNFSFIGMALFAAPWFDPPILALAWAVFLGGVLQLGLQLVALRRIGMLPRPSLRISRAWRDEGVRRILKLMAPATLGVSVSQVSLLINTIFASCLVSGSVSWLYYADRLMELPAGVLGAALGAILLPSLVKCHATDDWENYRRILDWGLRLTLLLALPAALALAILSMPLIATLFHHGAFTAHDVLQTRVALVAYSFGLTGMILVKVLAPGFYARQDIRTPVRIALLSLAATQCMNLMFIFGLGFAHFGFLPSVASLRHIITHFDQIRFGHAGLALSIGLAACFNAFLLYRGLCRRHVFTPLPGWRGFSLKLLPALGILGVTLWFGMGSAEHWLAYGFAERLARLGILVAGGMVVYFAALWFLGFRPGDFKLAAAT